MHAPRAPHPKPISTRHNRHEHHHLSQPGLRHFAQRARFDPRGRDRADHHRISENPTQPRGTDWPDRPHGHSVRALLREKGTPYAELGLDDESLTDDAMLDAMMAHPILINRPIVVTAETVKLCRPSETVKPLLT
ncbi:MULTISPECIES: ArsC/Spx/MgsR family protein [unclassified Acidiphilium]|uniref:ArsC/Spx/MgsR family protein n=1 Tax=Acidiphilium TaxID=522 RepID=UPI00338E9C05